MLLVIMNNLLSFNALGDICIYLVLILVNISYCPGVILTPVYSAVMTVIMTLIVVCMAINISRCGIYALYIYLYYLVVSLLYSSIVFFFFDVFLFSVTYNIFLSITCFLSGYCMYNNRPNYIYNCMKVFIISSLILGLYSVYNNLGGFIISEQYVFSVKNSSGVLLGSGIVLCLFIMNKARNNIEHIIWGIIMVLLILCLLTFRCRTAIISVFLCIMIYLYKNKLISKIFHSVTTIFVFAVFFTLIIAFDILPIGYIYDSLFANKDVSSLDSVTSGRLSTYDKGLQVFNECPMLGNAIIKRSLPPIDNFIIGHLSFYGILGLLLVLPAYLFTWYICLTGVIKNKIEDLPPFFLLFLLCMTSFTEGPYPFGPGTPVFCAWFMYGWWSKKEKMDNFKILIQ